MFDIKTMTDVRNTNTEGSGQQAIVVVKVDGTILHWDRTAETLFGYAAKDAIGASLDLIVPDEH